MDLYRLDRLRTRSRSVPRFALLVIGIATGLMVASPTFGQHSVSRQWNQALLDSIRIDFPAPTVHSRNLYHTSSAMYDTWAAFDSRAQGHFYTTKHSTADIPAARNEAISYAAYRVLSHRYGLATDPVTSQQMFDDLMDSLNYDKTITTTVGNSPAAIGNRIAQTIIDATLNDGSNEGDPLKAYKDNTGYVPINPPMTVDFASVTDTFNTALTDPNRWQPLFIESFTAQNGIVLGSNLQEYVGPHWGNVTPFAMGRNPNPGPYSWSSLDPGPAPQLGGPDSAEYTQNTMQVLRFSNSLDPTKGPGLESINISPNTSGNRTLGTHTDQGYPINPVTGQPYADNFVKVGDYGRVLAEFWADGPASETPPGHWNVIANEVSEHPLLEKRIGGTGPVVDNLEWDTKLYFALNGAVHDAAIAAWGSKRVYDYVRPITMIRYQGGLGQSSDDQLTSYHPDGLPLEAELVELITAESIAEGGKHRNAYVKANRDHKGDFFPHFTEEDLVDKIAVLAWNREPEDPETQLSGTDWILAEHWVPYQQNNFITPAFASYVSGHSTFSRAAAEVMTQFTGSQYFPEGLGEMTFTPEFLDFEIGPSEAVTLQWASYYDAADEAGISRLWGGIHVAPDDFAGRVIGSVLGASAYDYAIEHFGVPEPSTCFMVLAGCVTLGIGLPRRRC